MTYSMSVSRKQEQIGVVLALVAAAMWGLFPVFVQRGVQSIPPITFAALSTLLAAVGSLVYAYFQGVLGELRKREAYQALWWITLYIVIVPYILFLLALSIHLG